jgi:hypothetical protein
MPVYVLALGFSPQVGVIAPASLLGSSALTIGIGFLGVTQDHRRLLIAAACLMLATAWRSPRSATTRCFSSSPSAA